MSPHATRRHEPPTPATILVVDDSVAMRRIIERSLAQDGYVILEAADGREALDVCRTELPDLVLLDVDMPVMDGLATLREMKRDARLRSLPVLFLSARTAGEDAVAGLTLGAQDYVRKPCEPAELRARVAAALTIRAQQELLRRQADALDELSATDALTGLGNRRRFAGEVDHIMATCGRQAAVAVAIIDVDRFKVLNDGYGHAVGDLVLRVVGERLRRALAADQTVVRWGGEEFVVLARNVTAPHDAHALGERLRCAVGGTPIAVAGTQPLSVTVSVGVALCQLGDVDAGLHDADAALYRAKAAGRDRVELMV